ncbi:MAG TPA: NAD-binding protein [Roseiflexaceae bacterium]|nr:NAD-binding protein [Roseiflexaceae bacterium]
MAGRLGGQEYVVIGFGRFGSSLALRLVSLGHSVLAIDRDRDLVQQLSDEITQTVRAPAESITYPEEQILIG